jgi:hypothetical protein
MHVSIDISNKDLGEQQARIMRLAAEMNSNWGIEFDPKANWVRFRVIDILSGKFLGAMGSLKEEFHSASSVKDKSDAEVKRLIAAVAMRNSGTDRK